jgi:hypothetical protein
MSTQITTAFIQQFSSVVDHLNQQDGSLLRSAVRNESIQGEKSFYDQLGPTIASKRTARHAPTVYTNSAHDRRMVTADTYDWSDLIDQPDRIATIADFDSPYAKSAAMAIGRAHDHAIIAAALGTAYKGKDGTSTATIGASNQIAVNFGGSSVGLTVAKLRRARYLLSANKNNPREQWYLVGGPKQQDDLLATTEVTSADYNSVRALVNGDVNTFLGFQFIWTPELVDPLMEGISYVSSTDIATCFAFRKTGLLLATGKELDVRMDTLPQMNYSTQIWASATFGATRMEEGSVVSIACDQSP